jgi:hypothetical protein
MNQAVRYTSAEHESGGQAHLLHMHQAATRHDEQRAPVWATAANAGRLVGVVESAEAREMDFEELLDRACDSASLPEMARLLLPSTLNAETKNLVLKLTPEEFGRILASAIEAVNHGSVDTVDALVRKALQV